MESDLGSPGKTRKLMIWTSWPADCLASWLAGRRSLVKPCQYYSAKPMSVLFCEADVKMNAKPMSG